MKKSSRQLNFKFQILLLCLSACLFSIENIAQTLAPGAPGKDAQWSSAGKQAIGTSANKESKIWFTLQGGALTEVYYPDVTIANVHKLEFVVVNPKTKKVETETADAIHQIKPLRVDSLSFQQINTAKSGEWKITKTYTTDVERDSILIDVRFEPKNKDLNLYIYYDPSLGNTGMRDTSWTQDGVMMASDKNKISALAFSFGRKSPNQFQETTNGFFGVSDGLTQLKQKGEIKEYTRAENGNIVQFARIPFDSEDWTPAEKMGGGSKSDNKFTIALGFSENAKGAIDKVRQSLFKGFERTRYEYEQGWNEYIKTIPKVEPKYQAQFNMAAMVLKAQEDKTVAGANVASLTIPWGGGANANEDIGGGYHLVWSRDLYQVFTAYMALGDQAAANRALDFLFNIQQKPDGSFPQNSWLDGRCGWCSLQMDEVAYPLIMAYQLKRFDKKTYENHVKKAADFIVKNGPRTEQERWEEEAGFSPSTIAAEIAGLVCAADIAKRNGDSESENLYLKIADEWQESVEKWTVTKTGKYSKDSYYVRITQNGKPDAGERIELNNGAGFFDEREIVDAGFLELVRLGIKSPDDKIIQNSLKVVDEVLRVNTPNGESFYRYNNDGYGEMEDGRRWNWDGKYTGKGRLWALLAGERGQYELALAEATRSKNSPNFSKMVNESLPDFIKAKSRLNAMANFANESLMIAEQIWDKPETPQNIDKQFVPELKFGEGTGSATPLAWSMAQFIRLAVNLKEGRNLDTPDIVYNRYVLGKKDVYREPDSAITRLVENGEKYGEPKVKFGDSKKYETQNDNKSSDESEVKNQEPEIKITPEQLDCLAAQFNYKSERSAHKFPVIKRCGSKTYYAVFAYEGNAEKVELVGDFTNWKSNNLFLQTENFGPAGIPRKEYELVKNKRYYVVEFAPSARVEYKLIVDGKWINDPLNPNKVDNGVGGENSFFTMPDYKPTVWADSSGMTKSGINIEKISSKIYGEREIKIYVPENSANQNLPVMYLSDGTDYINRADAITIQRNLVKANKIKPFIMVFVDYKDRTKEYWATDDYAKFLATEVVPAIDKQYKTIKSRDSRAIFGTSLGGITSVHTALKYPEIFGRVGGQSSAFWVDDERVIKEVERFDAGKNKFKFYLDSGTLEGADDDRRVAEILRKKNFDVTFQTGETGHNWTSWRDRLADAFIALWSDKKG